MKRKFLRFWYSLRSGKERSSDYNRIHGKFKVKYKDGAVSMPMCYDVCKDYASIFGGTVIDNF